MTSVNPETNIRRRSGSFPLASGATTAFAGLTMFDLLVWVTPSLGLPPEAPLWSALAVSAGMGLIVASICFRLASPTATGARARIIGLVGIAVFGVAHIASLTLYSPSLALVGAESAGFFAVLVPAIIYDWRSGRLASVRPRILATGLSALAVISGYVGILRLALALPPSSPSVLGPYVIAILPLTAIASPLIGFWIANSVSRKHATTPLAKDPG